MSQRVPASRRPAALPAVFAGALIALFGPAITAQAQVLNPPPPAYTPPTLTAAYACQGGPGERVLDSGDHHRGLGGRQGPPGPAATGAYHVKVSPSLPAGAGTFDIIYPASRERRVPATTIVEGQPLSQQFALEDAAMNTKDPGLGVFDIPNIGGRRDAGAPELSVSCRSVAPEPYGSTNVDASIWSVQQDLALHASAQLAVLRRPEVGWCQRNGHASGPRVFSGPAAT